MTGATSAPDLDAVLEVMASSQHMLLRQVEPIQEHIHACTDITGFGLLGHLSEMLENTPDLKIQLDGSAIPAYSGALNLFESGISSTLALQPGSLAVAGWISPATTRAFHCTAGAGGGPADLWPSAAGLHQRSR